MNIINCLCFACKECKNEELVCKEEIELKNPCYNCGNCITIECSGYQSK